jgi:hypothetical protein
MEKANCRVQSDAFERRFNVVPKQRIDEREECIDPIQRWPARAAVETERLTVACDHVVEYRKVGLASRPFMATRLIDGRSARGFKASPGEPVRSLAEGVFPSLIGNLAGSAEQHYATVRDLCSHDGPHGEQSAIRAIGHSILLTPQQNVA